MLSINALVEWIKDRKTWWMETQEFGDMPPIVIAESDNVLVVATSPEQDRDFGLLAASVLFSAFRPERIIFIGDAHVDTAASVEEFDARYPRGMQHACDQDHACETTNLSDCMMANIMRSDGTNDALVIPYRYVDHDSKREVVWKDEEIQTPLAFDRTVGGGVIAEDMRDNLLRSPAVSMLFQMVANKLGVNPNDPQYRHHIHRGAMRYLEKEGFILEKEMDFRRTFWTPQGGHRWHRQEASVN